MSYLAGMLPRTWEDPARRGLNGTVGDNDPLDVMELGSRPCKVGEVRQVRAEMCLLFRDTKVPKSGVAGLGSSHGLRANLGASLLLIWWCGTAGEGAWGA